MVLDAFPDWNLRAVQFRFFFSRTYRVEMPAAAAIRFVRP
jgi:hypothetical protein